MMKMQLIQGISPVQTITNYKDSEDVMIRKTIRSSWNNQNAVGVINGYGRAASQMKSVNNITDFLSRKNYRAGDIPNPSNTSHSNVFWKIGSIIKHCDKTGVACANSNTKWVCDSSDFTRYKKQSVFAKNYNDVSAGGDQNNGSQTA
jgi:hypothetical protein